MGSSITNRKTPLKGLKSTAGFSSLSYAEQQ